VNQPTYLISYTFSVRGRTSGHGHVADFTPARNGSPCTFAPEHVKEIIESVAKSLGYATTDVGVTITNVWRYEE